MVFSSLIFLWFFLPIILIGYYIVQNKFKNIFLLLGSLIFYAWGEPKYIFLMIGLILINYGIGILIDKYERKRKLLLVSAVIINISVLGYFKYLNFFIEIINTYAGKAIELREIKLPIGISFFTFQILSYVIDLYRGQYKAQKNIINLALYISFFPQLIAGPIVKYKDINEQLDNRVLSYEQIANGIRRFIYGLGKKVIIANTVAQCVDTIYALEYIELGGGIAWVGAVLYTLQIYYDFSGYSDMAIGLGKMFGFKFHENFIYPYLSCSIQEFWQRWHISLGAWFREYIYIPLGGNRKGKLRTYFNLLVVFFTTGLWHGASFNFIIWGIYHGLFQIIERLGVKKFLAKHKVISHMYAIIVIVFGWVVFRADNLAQAYEMIKRMILPWKYKDIPGLMLKMIGRKTLLIILLGILGSGLIQLLLQKVEIPKKGKNLYLEIIYCVIMFILCIAMLASNTYNPFIYFRF